MIRKVALGAVSAGAALFAYKKANYKAPPVLSPEEFRPFVVSEVKV